MNTDKPKTIGLCMIVKNEADIIVRCMESVRPLLDYVLIEDTGSTDGTQEIVRSYLRENNLAGEVVDAPWRDFAANRSSALGRLREHAEIDYALIMDADDVLVMEPGFDVAGFKASMTADVYNLWITLGPVTYHRPQICSNLQPFYYRGVLHEFLETPASANPTPVDVVGLTIVCGRDGARGKSAEKYLRDSETLRKALETETDSLLLSRYTFYLAQSYRDFGEAEKALPLYLKRVEQGHWDQERFISLFEAARLQDQLGYPSQEVIGNFLRAYEICPTRAESLHAAMLYCRVHSLFHQGYLIGKQAVTITRPAAGLFLQNWVYEYGLFDEFSVNAYWAGHYAECRDYAERILREGKISEVERARIAKNIEFSEAKLQEERA